MLPPPAPSTHANATDLGTKRNASRLPSPDEVIRMLVSLAERTLESPLIHDELDASSNDATKEHAKGVKTENARWEAQKKSLSTAQLKAKAAESKKIAEEVCPSKVKLIRYGRLQKNTNYGSLRSMPISVPIWPNRPRVTLLSVPTTRAESTISSLLAWWKIMGAHLSDGHPG